MSDYDDTKIVSMWSVIGCFIIVFIVAAILFPVFAKCGHTSDTTNCQSNMSQIGRALKLYLQEWNDTFPMNRERLPNGKLGSISSRVKLTPLGNNDSNGKPEKYRYGINWVEALSPYTEFPTKDCPGCWQCRSAKNGRHPVDSDTALVSYTFNRNMIERPEIAMRHPATLLIVREMDRLVDAELRPTNYSCGRPYMPPDSPFLTKYDSQIGETNPDLHNHGSNIIFADGHVNFINCDYFPEQKEITASKYWDKKNRQWFFDAGRKKNDPYLNGITITP